MNNRDGFSVVALLVLAGVLVVAGSAYLSFSNECSMPWSTLRCIDADDVRPIACTEEARICPDGSAVARIGPKCEFAPCPTLRRFDGNECAAQGGEIVNTLHFQDGTPPDYTPEEVIGEIVGTNCPCVCVKRAATAGQVYQGVIAEFLTQWPEIQKAVPYKPILGSTSWYVTAFGFLSPTRFLVSFEDGHVAGAAVVDAVTVPGQNLRKFSILETVHPNKFPFTDVDWRSVLAKYNASSDMVKIFVTSVVRGTEMVTYNGWVEVPENPLVFR